MSASRKKAAPGGVAGNKSGEAADPEGFAFWCGAMGPVAIGKRDFPINIPAIDRWIADQGLPQHTVDELLQSRNAAVRAYLSNDPEAGLQAILRLHKDVRLLQAQALAHERQTYKQTQKNTAKKPRPKRGELKRRVTTIMLAEKAGGVTLKTLLERWIREPIQGLRLRLERDVYFVSDEEGDLRTRSYKLSTLTTMFSGSVKR